ncbi:MAG: ORF6N domain-containing protein [Bacteroidetes bacterium]|jgi:hypothetical protein|nr:ORF6N domain-containing protein [Bacteroidota bacterium]MBT5528032.1 ORF6N domain-containing protein [Cytophagia bacterium]MBT3424524.1 ORF6N domain-containing protein [Bacteroidota bacterium]MBT3802182.1 ORF6N domain-containing protein [Bacteroidota bacterium]MBT3933356.1 ORF6N domain-containing protein [Bacteroidota bacterium]
MSENKEGKIVLADEIIMTKILKIRDKKVIIDRDLAELYDVSTKRLNEQVKRNIKRFPAHFMFELTKTEKDEVVAICDHLESLKYSSFSPRVFTEYGILQAANVLNSDRAILMGNRIIEIFVKMHNMLSSHQEILEKIEELEKKDLEQDDKIMLIFEYIKQFEETKRQQSEQVDRKQIGFNIDKEA